MKLSVRSIYPGLVEGEALVSPLAISFFGGVDPDSGVVVERGHALEGRSVAGKVLVFPSGKGSTVGSYTLYRLRAGGMAPLAIVNAECETITAVGCIIAEIPCVDQVDLGALATGQRLRVDAGAGLVEILPPNSPPAAGADGQAAALPGAALPALLREHPPEPMRGSEPGSFAEHTFTHRLPRIANDALAAADWPAEIRRRLQHLIDEMPHGRLRPLEDPGAPDLDVWEKYMRPFYGLAWLTAPWMPAEGYFFRRVLEASGYYQPGPGQGVDPYRKEKWESLRKAVDPLAEECAALETWIRDEPLLQALARLLRRVVWGNQADLSVFPSGGKSPERSGDEHLLVDQAASAADYLAGLQGKQARIDILFDNSGMDLASDLLLVDFLLEHGFAGQIVLHPKPLPTYVSDVTPDDLNQALAVFAQAGDARVRWLAQRLQARLNTPAPTGRVGVSSELHWAGAEPNWKTPPELRRDLAGAALIISKGDLNYRRWLGDLHWPFTTPFEAVTAYRPAPLLALRVIKSNVLAGLPPGLEDEMYRRDAEWPYNGNWGVIQFAA